MLRLTNKRREEASVKRALTLENEIELIEGCRAGKDSARKELYTLYSKQMLAVCYRYTGDVDAAHDVLHDGFIKIFTHFTFRGECALNTVRHPSGSSATNAISISSEIRPPVSAMPASSGMSGNCSSFTTSWLKRCCFRR